MIGRSGFILVYAVLLILSLSLLSAGMMVMAAREGSISRAHVRIVQARATAEAAVRVAVAAWPQEIANLSVGDSIVVAPNGNGPSPIGSTDVEVTRLAGSLYLVRAEVGWIGIDGSAETPHGGPSAAMMIRTLDRSTALLSFPAAVTADSLAEVREAAVTGMDACASPEGSLPGVLAPSIHLDAAAVDGDPPTHEVAPEPRAVDDPLTPMVVDAVRDIAVTGTGTPRPGSAGGECLVDPWNWGATSPADPCHALLPIIGAEDDLTVEGGDARAILVVSGHVRLDGPMTFDGLILATGSLVVGPDVRVRGAVRAQHVVVDGGEIVLDRCTLDEVLMAPALRTPLQHRSRWWIPSF